MPVSSNREENSIMLYGYKNFVDNPTHAPATEDEHVGHATTAFFVMAVMLILYCNLKTRFIGLEALESITLRNRALDNQQPLLSSEAEQTQTQRPRVEV